MSDPVADFMSGLPEASGTFTGEYDPDNPAVQALFESVPDLLPVTTDTYNRPNPVADAIPGQSLTIDTGTGKRYSLIIDHVEPLEGNAVRAWCQWPEPLS